MYTYADELVRAFPILLATLSGGTKLSVSMGHLIRGTMEPVQKLSAHTLNWCWGVDAVITKRYIPEDGWMAGRLVVGTVDPHCTDPACGRFHYSHGFLEGVNEFTKR